MRTIRLLTAVFIAATALTPALAQETLPRPGQNAPPAPPSAQPPQRAPAPAQAPKQGQPAQQAAPTVAPPKPYKPLSVIPPQSSSDASLAAFREQVGQIAEKKDRAGLARHVVAQGFFWLKPPQGQDGADKKKLGIDNLAAAIGLAARDGSGWDALAELVGDDTAMPLPNRNGVLCAPADPKFNPTELEALAKATGTDPGEWGYTTTADVEVRAQAQANAPVIEKLGLHFVRVMPEQQSQNEESAFIRIVTPSGRIGFIAEEQLMPLGGDQLCFAKDASGAWKITGFIGGQE